MAKKIGVLIVHGIGNQPAGYADDMIAELRDRLADKGVDGKFAFKAAYWGDVLAAREDELYRNLESTGASMWWKKARRNIVINAFGDAIAYAGCFTQGSWAYDAIHRAIARDLETLAELAGNDRAPLVLLTHSLGCQIMSNYLWDHRNGPDDKRFGRSALARGDTLAMWITFGCNIPLFLLARHEDEVHPVGVPGVLARSAFTRTPPKEALRWYNYYDPDDLLGFPLRGLPGFADCVAEDVAIDTGTIIGAHMDYWTDNAFTKPVTEHLAALAEYL